METRPAVAWGFLAPFLLLFAIFTLWPLCLAISLALQQTSGPGVALFVGLENFQFLFADPLFWKALANTALFASGSLFLQLPVSLGLALLLNRPNLRGRTIFRLIFFSPALFGAVFVGVLFGLIFEQHTGLLNIALHRLTGWPLDFPWLQEFVMPALILAALWMFAGFNMIYFLAALQAVDATLLEAARMDGANTWQRFRHITIPQIAPVAGVVVLLSLLGSFQLFELPYLLLGQTSGPDNQGLTIVMYLYQTGFEIGDLGYASAIGWVLAVLLIFLALIQRRLGRRWEG